MYGYEGIQPADIFLSSLQGSNDSLDNFFATPTLLWFHSALSIDIDYAMDLITIIGAVLSSIALLGFGSGFVMAGCWICYLSLYAVGQTFLSFQWDIILLEAGFITIFYAPVINMWYALLFTVAYLIY